MTWHETLAFLSPCLPEKVTDALHHLDAGALHELRIRAGSDVQLCCHRKTISLPLQLAPSEITRICEALTGHNLYARSSETSMGYVTLRGGHRLGLCGFVHDREGKSILQHIASLCLRIAAEIPGCSASLFPYAKQGLLLVGPPASGKTTLLRDLARQISSSGIQTALIDERCELSACLDGSPQLDIGCCDVLSGLSKPQAVRWLIRSMAPQYIVTDELAGDSDAHALLEAYAAGAQILASIHGRSLRDALARPVIAQLLQAHCFGAYALLSDTEPGKILSIRNRNGETLL